VQTVGMIANCRRETAIGCAGELHACLEGWGIRTLFPPELAEALGQPLLARSEEELGKACLVVALGGDGTLLAANRIAAPHGTPVLGVHVGGPGSFGFLTETTPPHAAAVLADVLAGRHRVEERLMVAARVSRQGECVGAFSGLNEIVIRAQSRMLKLRVEVSGTFISTYAADGILVATPTGSTAYNLASGGPLVHPSVETILLTPICPHTLNVRSLLVSREDLIRIRLESQERDVTLLTVDGQVRFDLEPQDEILFSRSEHSARFISLNRANFYQKVQTRLRLGERFGGEGV
jgi:NAD+ kinase